MTRTFSGDGIYIAQRDFQQILLRGTANKNEQLLANAIIKGGRELMAVRNLLGPVALATGVAFEAGLVGFDMLNEGKTFREAVGDSLFNYALGDKTKIDPKEERYKRYKARRTGSGYASNCTYRCTGNTTSRSRLVSTRSPRTKNNYRCC